MRRPSIFAFLVVSAIVGCTPSSRNAPPPGPGQVRMKLTCAPDGSLNFAIDPWSVTLPDKHAAFKFFNDGNTDGVINAQNPTYPFGSRRLTAPHGGGVDGKPDIGTPAGTYKYLITVACPVSGGPPKITVIDPDMIIPWKIDQN